MQACEWRYKSKDCKIIGSPTKETETYSEDGETLKGREDDRQPWRGECVQIKGKKISTALANKVAKKKANKRNKTQNAAVGHLLRSKKVAAILNEKIITPMKVVTRPGKKRATPEQASAVTPGEKKPVSPAKVPIMARMPRGKAVRKKRRIKMAVKRARRR